MKTAHLRNLETSGELLLDLGPQPVSNRFLAADDLAEAPYFPLQLRLCKDTGLIHLGKPFPVEELKPRYDWLTCFEPEDHLDDLAERLTRLSGITRESIFGAYSFKDDTTLRRLENLGYGKNWRIDPATDLGVTNSCANVETYQIAFTSANADKIRAQRGLSDVFIVRHVVEHAYNMLDFIQAIRTLVRPGGYIVWEIPDCERSLAVGDCTMVWEEHTFYFTSVTFKQLLLESGFSIFHYESVPYPLENSLIAIVQDASSDKNVASPDPQVVAKEVVRARGYAQALVRSRIAVRKKLESIRRERGSIALFGAGHLSVAFLAVMGVKDLIRFVVDDNAHKKGMRMPVGQIEIVGSESLYSAGIKVCLLGLNPQNQPKLVAKHQRFVEQGGVFASIFPGSELDVERMK